MHCLDCQYPLHALDRHRCPECGRAFDPDDPSTYDDGATDDPLKGIQYVCVPPILLLGSFCLTPAFGHGTNILWAQLVLALPMLIGPALAVGLSLRGVHRCSSALKIPAASVLLISLVVVGFFVIFLTREAQATVSQGYGPLSKLWIATAVLLLAAIGSGLGLVLGRGPARLIAGALLGTALSLIGMMLFMDRGLL